jgi:hypothetical protein
MLSRRHLGWLSERVGLQLASVYQCSHYSVPLVERLRQHLQAFAYEQFRSSPSGAVAQALRLVPRLGNARRWTTAPALNCLQDHVVAFLERPQQ